VLQVRGTIVVIAICVWDNVGPGFLLVLNHLFVAQDFHVRSHMCFIDDTNMTRCIDICEVY
jgi:hypothetical protein